MKQIRFSFNLVAVFIFSLVWVSSARAQLSYTFVSRTGADANTCAIDQPCRTFAGATTKTNAGGHITALDTGLYGVVTIKKPVTIQAAPGVHAALDAGAGQTSVTISAGANNVIVIRNLSIVTNDGGSLGVRVTSAGSVHVEKSVITGFVGANGIGLSSSGSTRLYLNDTVVRKNGFGLFITGAASIDHCLIENNNSTGFGYGVGVAPGAKVTITDSVIAGHSIGLSLQNSTNGELNVERCTVSNNSAAGISIVSVFGPAGTVRVSNSTVTNNGVGFQNSSGTFQTRRNNTVRGNGQDTQGVMSAISGT